VSWGELSLPSLLPDTSDDLVRIEIQINVADEVCGSEKEELVDECA
jgi:hypothetical protein